MIAVPQFRLLYRMTRIGEVAGVLFVVLSEVSPLLSRLEAAGRLVELAGSPFRLYLMTRIVIGEVAKVLFVWGYDLWRIFLLLPRLVELA